MTGNRTGTSSGPSMAGWLAVALATVVSTGIAARSWVTVRLHRDRHIEVTGSAKRRIVSDLIEWRGTVTTENMDRTAAYKQLREHVERTLAYLKKQGVAETELRVYSVESEEIIETEYQGKGDDRIERKIKKASAPRRPSRFVPRMSKRSSASRAR